MELNWAIWCYNCSPNSVCYAWLAPTGDRWQPASKELSPQGGPLWHLDMPLPSDNARTSEPEERKGWGLCRRHYLQSLQGERLNAPSKMLCLPVPINARIQRVSLKKVKREDDIHWKGRKKNIKLLHPFQKHFMQCNRPISIFQWFASQYLTCLVLFPTVLSVVVHTDDFLCPQLPLPIT